MGLSPPPPKYCNINEFFLDKTEERQYIEQACTVMFSVQCKLQASLIHGFSISATSNKPICQYSGADVSCSSPVYLSLRL